MKFSILILFIIMILSSCSKIFVDTSKVPVQEEQKEEVVINEAKNYIDAGIAYYDSAKYKQAIAAWKNALEFSPYDAEIYNYIGVAQQHQNKIEQAKESFKKAVNLKSDYYQAYNNLGYMYFLLDEYENALQEFDSSLTINPEFEQAKNNKKLVETIVAGKISKKAFEIVEKASKELDYAEQIKLYQEALNLNPDYAKAHNNIAVAYYYEDYQDSAYAHLIKAIKINKEYPEAINNLGYLYKNDGKYDMAIKLFLKAITLQPKSIVALNNLGETYLLNNEAEKAKKVFAKVLEIDPQNKRAKAGMEKITG